MTLPRSLGRKLHLRRSLESSFTEQWLVIQRTEVAWVSEEWVSERLYLTRVTRDSNYNYWLTYDPLKEIKKYSEIKNISDTDYYL